ncbi:hypothetical protein L7H23_00900 [Sphingopyxis sp. BSN-002]|uniref:hypothetical protein n=1 Tax=Sphingopyxis sp. BSN-002 TaxID=2911495 RepID=UPI001EDBC580|nr:hypothetical protein [Sphingopyxis sp. BSN-002]UKK84692.1 hypothetical protein L7H23_00900 [Sphingopyxis sp. BSN-002]
MLRNLFSALAALSLFAGGVMLGSNTEPFRRGYISGGEFLLWPAVLVGVWAVLTWFKKRIGVRAELVERFK